MYTACLCGADTDVRGMRLRRGRYADCVVLSVGFPVLWTPPSIRMLHRKINWTTLVFVASYHLLLVGLAPFVFGALTWTAWLGFGFTFVAGGLAITAGYHRLYAHRAYDARPVFEWAVLLASTLAFQWSALVWSHDHRLHHNHVDTDKDPYSVKKGFWHAHMLWLFTYRREFDTALVADLLRNPRVVFQDRYYLALAVGVNAVVLGLACLFMHPLAALWAVVLLRIFAVHHCTWFINSLAHVWGSRTYARELSAVDNAVLAFLTFGEGYHNYHHSFQHDYRNGVKPWQWDPTKWAIWTLSKLGLVSELRRVPEEKILLAELREMKRLAEAQLESGRSWTVSCPTREEAYQALLEMSQQLGEGYHELEKSIAAQIKVSRAALMRWREICAQTGEHLMHWRSLEPSAV